MRHEAQREGALGARRGAIDAWERGLLENMMLTQDSGWYTDNGKYRQVVTLVFEEWEKGRDEVCQEARKAVKAQPRGVEGKEGQGGDSASVGGQAQAPHAKISVEDEGTSGSGALEDGVLDDVAALHSKFFQDPNFTGRKGKFAGVDAFDAGIDRLVRPEEGRTQVCVPSFERGVCLWMCSKCSLQPVLLCWWWVSISDGEGAVAGGEDGRERVQGHGGGAHAVGGQRGSVLCSQHGAVNDTFE